MILMSVYLPTITEVSLMNVYSISLHRNLLRASTKKMFIKLKENEVGGEERRKRFIDSSKAGAYNVICVGFGLAMLCSSFRNKQRITVFQVFRLYSNIPYLIVFLDCFDCCKHPPYLWSCIVPRLQSRWIQNVYIIHDECQKKQASNQQSSDT